MPLLIIQDQTLNHIIDKLSHASKWIGFGAVIGGGIVGATVATLAYAGVLPGIGNIDNIDDVKKPTPIQGDLTIPGLNPRSTTYVDCVGVPYQGKDPIVCLNDADGSHAYVPLFDDAGKLTGFNELTVEPDEKPAFQQDQDAK